MLEAERAGAKALVVFMDEHPHGGEIWKTMRHPGDGFPDHVSKPPRRE